MHIEGCGSRENSRLRIEAMGSYRRCEETCGDLDILISRDPSDGKDHTRKLNRSCAIFNDCMLNGGYSRHLAKTGGETGREAYDRVYGERSRMIVPDAL